MWLVGICGSTNKAKHALEATLNATYSRGLVVKEVDVENEDLGSIPALPKCFFSPQE